MPFERTINADDLLETEDVCNAIRREHGERIVIVKELTRTDKQNRLFWVSCCEPLAQWLTATEGQQWTKEDVCHELKLRFLPVTQHRSPITGATVVIPKSTTQLTRSEFSLLYEKGMMVLEKVKGEHLAKHSTRATRTAYEGALRR